MLLALAIIVIILLLPVKVRSQAQEELTPLPAPVILAEPEVKEAEKKEMTVPELIEKYAKQYKVNASLAYKIADCESDFNPKNKNPRSTASGVFQFLRGSWNYYGTQLWGSMKGKDVFNAEQNIELAMYVMSKRGTVDWNASRYCWGK